MPIFPVAPDPSSQMSDPFSLLPSFRACTSIVDAHASVRDLPKYHIPNTSKEGAYDTAGNYWCADCADRLLLMNVAAQLGWPEISYFPHNRLGLRSVQIGAGYEQWRKRLPVMSKPDDESQC